MNTLIAEIASYSVHFAHGNNHSRTPYRNRFIHLRFKPNKGNLVFYSLSFVPETKYASTGTLEKQKTGDFHGTTIIPIDEFSVYYEVMRHEKPISIRVDFDDDPQTTPVGEPLPLKSFSFFTGDSL